MKLVSFLLIVLVLTSGMVFAQSNFQLSEVKIYSGECALSTGLGAVATMVAADGSKSLSLEVNASLGQVVYMKKVALFFGGPTFGLQSNAMWVAPIFIFNPWKFISFTSWEGFSAGIPRKPSWQPNFLFGYQAVDVTVGRLGFGYSLLHYLKERPMNLPYVKLTIPIGPVGIDLSATYHVRDEKPMFFIQGFYKIGQDKSK